MDQTYFYSTYVSYTKYSNIIFKKLQSLQAVPNLHDNESNNLTEHPCNR